MHLRPMIGIIFIVFVCMVIAAILNRNEAGAEEGYSEIIIQGTVAEIDGDKITLESGEVYEAAGEHSIIPKWVSRGIKVKISFYYQEGTNYFTEIQQQGRLLEKEKYSGSAQEPH